VTPAIAFNREGRNIFADIIKTAIEPLDNTHQVVFFCQDSDGYRYRVPKSDVLVMGRSKKKARGKRCSNF
jgi:hypothetical protein